LLEVRGNIKYKNKNHQILYIWFFVCSQKYRRMLQDVYTILFLVYRKIWLNLPRADCRLLLHLPMDGCHFGYQQKIPKTNHWCKHGSYTFFCVHGLFQGVLWNVIFVCCVFLCATLLIWILVGADLVPHGIICDEMVIHD